jgi:3-isopropylmalate/(R)-2-methylmalate dehydratase small subunit
MKAFRIVTGRAVPLKRSDVDTDQIIPADWLKRVERTGFEKGLFSTWRDDRSFVLNDERYAGATILVAGPSFGVGSSREHAVWAIQQYGFDAVVAPSFSDIFRNNCTKNGLAPVVLPQAAVEKLWDLIEADANTEITIDMERLTVEVPAAGFKESFPMDAPTQHRFLNGLDDIGITLTHADAITSFEKNRPAWLAKLLSDDGHDERGLRRNQPEHCDDLTSGRVRDFLAEFGRQDFEVVLRGDVGVPTVRKMFHEYWPTFRSTPGSPRHTPCVCRSDEIGKAGGALHLGVDGRH